MGLACVEAQRPQPWSAETKLANGEHLFVTRNILSGFMFLALFLTIFLSGLSCLLGVQTPLSFGDEKNPIKPLAMTSSTEYKQRAHNYSTGLTPVTIFLCTSRYLRPLGR